MPAVSGVPTYRLPPDERAFVEAVLVELVQAGVVPHRIGVEAGQLLMEHVAAASRGRGTVGQIVDMLAAEIMTDQLVLE